jgi:AhpD family alkylhydroperoxidase
MSIKYIKATPHSHVDGVVKEIYSQIKHDFGAVVEPFLLHSSSPSVLGGVWAACRETELITGVVPRNVKELIASTISQMNWCPYCVDAHTIMLNAEGEHKVARLLSTDAASDIADPKLKAIYEWASSTRSPQSDIILAPPFSVQEAPEMIGMAVFYHYINKMVSVFLSETPLPLNVSWMKLVMKRFAGWYFSLSARRVKSYGDSLKFIPDARLPEDMGWAEGSSPISKAFAGFAAVVNEIGAEILPEEVRQCVQEYIHSWNGEHPEMNRHWVDQAAQGLNNEIKGIARLVLTASIAPYQVDEQMIVSFRNAFSTDDALLGALAWGSFAVAKKIGRWLYEPFTNFVSQRDAAVGQIFPCAPNLL